MSEVPGLKEQVYSAVSTKPIVVTPFSSNEDTNRPFVTEEKTFPAMTDREGLLPKRSLRERFVDTIRRIGDSKRELQFTQISRGHGRAFTEATSSRQVIWGDEYGNVYGARDFKGTVMDEDSLVIEPDGYLPDGGVKQYRLRGLRDKAGFARIEQASQFLRQNGLPTEVPIRVGRLNEVVVQGEKVPFGKWRRQKIDELKREVKWVKENDANAGSFKAHELERQIEYLSLADFFAIERDLQVSERLEDVLMLDSWAEARKLLKPTTNWLKAVGQVRNQGLISGTMSPPEIIFRGLTKADWQSGELKEDLKRYFGDWLPEQMGTYLGRLHKLEMIHGFPHCQNWSLVGSLYDLDTCWGVPLGDKSPEPKDYQDDVRFAEGAIVDVLMNGRLFSKVDPDLYKQALAHFIFAYIKERRGLEIDFTRVQKDFFVKRPVLRRTIEKFKFPTEEVWPQVEELFAQAKASVNK